MLPIFVKCLKMRSKLNHGTNKVTISLKDRKNSALPPRTKSPGKETHQRKKPEKNNHMMGKGSFPKSEWLDA